MKIAYAFRRSTFYPYDGDSRTLPDAPARSRFLQTVREIGFDGMELSLDAAGGLGATEPAVGELRGELEASGTPCVAIRGGGALCIPAIADHNRRSLEKAVEIAHWMGAEIVNTSLSSTPRDPRHPGPINGGPVSEGSSRLATSDDFDKTALALREVGEQAGAYGLKVAIEVHQHSIVDNSWSALRVLELADSSYVFANPDLGNVFWNYDEPEETAEEAILALAPHSAYWHCKNLRRINVPEIDRSYFVRVPLPDGDLDYRFAISAMVDAGYDGYLAVEGATAGDAIGADRRSFEYVKGVLQEAQAQR